MSTKRKDRQLNPDSAKDCTARGRRTNATVELSSVYSRLKNTEAEPVMALMKVLCDDVNSTAHFKLTSMAKQGK